MEDGFAGLRMSRFFPPRKDVALDERECIVSHPPADGRTR
jgi:hypothetical protein